MHAIFHGKSGMRRFTNQVRFFFYIFLFCIFMMPGTGRICFGAGLPDAAFEGKPIRRLNIELPEDQKNITYWQAAVRDLMLLKQGEPFSSQRFVRAVDILSDSGLFADIHVPDPKPFKDGISLVFRLKPFDRIKGIKIKGAFPFFKKDILGIMSLRVGDAFRDRDMEDQRERIVAFLKKEGYIDPQVRITPHRDDDDNHYILSILINKGPFLRVANIVLEGNQHLSGINFNLKTKKWNLRSLFGRGIRFVRADATADVKQILNKYRENGFADAGVTLEIRPRARKDEVDVVFNITEGSLYSISYTGNHAFYDWQLKKDIALFKEGNAHGFGIRKSVRNIKKTYVSHGFSDVKITSEIHESGLNSREVVFHIDEGPQYVISGLAVKGTALISEESVKEQVLSGRRGIFDKPVYIKKQLEDDLNAVRILYLNNGFTQAVVDKQVEMSHADVGKEEARTQVSIEILIQEGIRTQVGSIRFSDLPGLTEKQALEMISLKSGRPFRGFMVESDENIIKAAVSEKGYPHVEIETRVDLSPDKKTADLLFKCDPGPLVRMGQVIYTGNFRTTPATMDDEIDLTPNTPLSLNKLLESRRSIMNINALDTVRFYTPGLREKAREVDLVVAVQEKKPYYLEFGVGYDTRRKTYAETALGDHNFLGRNLNLETALEISRIGYESSLSLHNPRFLSSTITSSTRIFTEKKEEFNKDFGTKTHGVSLEFLKKAFDEKLTLGLGGACRIHEQYITHQNLETTQDSEAYDKRGILMLSPSLVFRTTDSYVRPKKGLLTTVNIDISTGIDNDLDNFIKYRLDQRFYVSPMKPLTLALRGRYGLIQPYGSNAEAPEDQLFFLGGTSTVRGFDENLLRFDTDNKAVGGKQSILGSIEARIDLRSNLELALFYDIGSISGSADVSGSDEFRSSVGGGIRYLTPIGPVSLLYGHKLDPKSGESNGSFHFSMGYTF